MTNEIPHGDQTPILIFVNSVSGGGIAAGVIPYVENDVFIKVVKLPSEASTFRETHAELLRNPSLRIVAAGGDGTVNWVISLLKPIFSLDETPNQYRPPLAVIPFGTGNDMSRSLGWGGGMMNADLHRVPEIIRKMRNSTHVENIDIWQLTLTDTSSQEVVTKQMLNYFSIGVDAEVALDFEHCRTGCCKCCFCCQCMSLCCYIPVGASNLFCKRNIRDYCKVMIKENDESEPREMLLRRGEKTVVVQAIPNIYAGRDLWRNTSDRGMCDHKFEVIAQGGVMKLGLLQIGCRTGRPIIQGVSTEMHVDEPFYYQVDGEGGMVNNPTTVKIERSGSYPMVFSE
ncbi:Diacylglycerol kinase 1 [Histomonas meleagridis]|uniref:Diacylglycerol kinase 1 n=1 Tax=Histomonas meleagridis TaxID=135588 RepID=UPI00355A54C8|nr:Diacylglycerol kinase 1 [Histomonas meleagridis]KAH0803111.1 Diacylglycerol kinase 1 [Histomonas meleagridis]